MEKQPSSSLHPSTAREQVRAARQAHGASLRRGGPGVMDPRVELLLRSADGRARVQGPGNVVTIIAVLAFIAALFTMSARNQWRSLWSLPRPRWGVAEVTLIGVAVVGGVVGPHLLAGLAGSALASWGLGAAVAVLVAGCMFTANASYRHRTSRPWPR